MTRITYVLLGFMAAVTITSVLPVQAAKQATQSTQSPTAIAKKALRTANQARRFSKGASRRASIASQKASRGLGTSWWNIWSSDTGRYALTVHEGGILLKGPKGSLVLDETGLQIQGPSPGVHMPVEINTAGCYRPIAPGVADGPRKLTLSGSTSYWSSYGSAFTGHSHTMPTADNISAC